MNQYVNTSRLIEELGRVERNVEALARAAGVSLPEVMAWAKETARQGDDDDNDNGVASMPLPRGLRHRVRNKEALERAVQYGYIEQRAEHWEWTIGTKTLLAYFMGRLLCGDRPRLSSATGKLLWHKGKGHFPDEELKELFGMGSLRSVRKNSFHSSLPKGHEMVDYLFDKE